MYPYFYQSDGLVIGSYGVMLAIAYLTGRHLFINNLSQRLSKPINTEVLIIGLLVCGVIGAKLMFMLKNPERASFDDWGSITSGSGFSSQGAVLAAIAFSYAFSRFNQISYASLLDAGAAPAMMAYAIARIGCFLAGDDCYGIPSDLPWAMAFPHGVAPTLQTVHPVPLYEIAYSLAIYIALTRIERQSPQPYTLFASMMFSWGLCRFLVEFVSSNPKLIMGMSGSQFGALLALLLAGSYLIYQKQTMGSLFNRQKKAG